MPTANLSEKLLKTYSDKSYQHTAMVTHKGTVIAFAMDHQQRIRYAVLNMSKIDPKKGEFDAAYWPENPEELRFPNEITQVGYSVVDNTRMPTVKADTRQEAANPSQLLPNEVDHFLSTTARLTADAPFQVFSDNHHIFVFRQAIAANDPNAVNKLNSGGASGDPNRPDSDFQLSDGNKVAIVDRTLLCDRFILCGNILQPNREVRYQRSRHKTRPASQTDSLGAKDMEGNPFFEPTQELAFIRNLTAGGFTVLQLPTQVNGIKRWQFFAHNSATQRIDAFNLEVAGDGLFNPQGTQLYTSPAPQYKDAVLEREPGADPFTGAALVPVTQATNHAETALGFDGSSNYVEVVLNPAWTPTAFTIEMWVRAAQQDLPESAGIFASSNSATTTGSFQIDSDGAGNWRFNHADGYFTIGAIALDWQHLVIGYDGTTLKGFLDGTEVLSQTLTLSSQFTHVRLGANRNADNLFAGQIDEARVWGYARTGYEINSDRLRRLIGNEPGLVGYWRFDEGAGNRAFDQTDKGNYGTIHGTPEWVASDAPIGDHPGMRRSSFSFTDRTIVDSLSAKLYYQQEAVATGYDGSSKPMKKSARVMVAAATNSSSGGDPAVATLDFAVSREGRLPSTPDAIDLPVLEQPQASDDTAAISSLEGEIRTLTDDIEQLNQEIAVIQSDVDRIPLETSIKQNLESEIAALQNEKAFEQANFKNHWCKLKLTCNQRYLVVEAADAGWVYASPNDHEHGDRVYWRFARNNDGSFYIYNKGRAGILVRGEPCHVLQNRTDSSTVHSVSTNQIRIGTSLEYWRSWDGNKYGGLGQTTPYDNSILEVIQGDLWNTTRISEITNQISQKQTQLNAQTTLVNSLIAQQALLSTKQSLFLQKQNNLTDKQSELSVLTGGEKQEVRLPMGLVHIDASGLTVNGSLIKFAPSTHTPTMLDGATGELTLYYPDDSGQFMAAYFQTLVARTRLQFAESGVTLLARSAGSNNMTATISDGRIINTCTLVITNPDRGITETWTDLPRDPQLFTDILNGTGDQPADVTATVSPSAYSVKERSLQVVASAQGQGEYQEQTDSQTALNLDGQNDYVDLPPEISTLINPEITIEFWAKGGAGLPKNTSIIDANNAAGERIFTIHFPWSTSSVTWDAGDAGNCDRLQLSVQDADYKGVWVHWAFVKNATDGTMAIYRNGNLAASGTGKTRSIGDFTMITLGCIPNSSDDYYWDGEIDECRIWSSARSEADILANMNQRLSGKEASLVACYSFENGKARDRSRNAYHGTVHGAPTSVDKPDALPALTATTILNGVVNGDATVTPGRDSLWIANTPGRAYYFSSNSDLLSLPSAKLAQTAMNSDLTVEAWVNPSDTNQGTSRLIHHCSADAAYTLALQKATLDSSLLCNGTSDYVEVSYRSQLNPSQFTVSCWVKVTGGDNNYRCPVCSRGDNPQTGYIFYAGSNNKWQFWCGNESGSWQTLTGSDVQINTWTHLAGTYDGQTMRFYVNGQLSDSKTTTFSPNTNYPLRIGAGATEKAPELYFPGQIDAVAIWQRDRSQTEIQADMNRRLQGNETDLVACYTFINGEAQDRGPNGYHGTIHGNPTVTAAPDQLLTYVLIAGVSHGTPGNHQGQRWLKSKETLTPEQWHHIALCFRQSHGLSFNGQSHLDCGNNQMLDIGEDLTIEAFIQFNNRGSSQGIIGKGFFDQQDKSVPYQLKVAGDGTLEFTFEDADGGNHTYYSTQALTPGTFYRVAVTRKKGTTQHQEEGDQTITIDGQNKTIKAIKSVTVDEWFDITFYINGVKRGVDRYDGEAPLGNDQPLEIGRCQSSPRQISYFQGTISEVRLWNKARDEKDIGKNIQGGESGLVSWWQFEENEGNVAIDSKSNNHGKIKGARWVRNPDPNGSPFYLLLNGLPLAAHALTSGTPNWGDAQFSMAGYKLNGASQDCFQGILEEVRIWRTLRTDEQIGDNLFTRLKGEKQDLLAYYTFDDDSSRSDATQLNDNSLRGNHLSVPSGDSKPLIFLSTAPISNDTAAVRSALASVSTDFHEQIDSTPSVVEYADLQRDNQGNLGGVLKRCYSYLQNGQWCLVTGYKVGNLVTEWIGQAQFDPQVIGYIEGVPPVPSENLTGGVVSSRYDLIEEVSNIEVVESETVTYTLSASKEESFDLGFKGAGSYSSGSDDLLITAPLGIGTAKKLVQAEVKVGVEGTFDTSNSWSQEESLGTSINRTRTMSVALGGSLEGAGLGQQLNPAVGRRVQPGNMGFALVQSQTADIFALRLAHNNALVSFRMLPNPDIPIDWNIIPFQMNPRYTKQGTLDGRVGYDEQGAVVLDPDYVNARQYGEYSYYKPKEAYAIERRIQREEQRLLNYYQNSDTEIAETGQIIGAAAGAAAGLMAGPLGMAVGAGVGSIVGGFGDALSQGTSLELPQKFAKRNLVNTYVWTADGGFFAETTETTDVKSEVTAGSFSFSGAVGGSFSTDVEIFSIGFNLAFEASIGGGFSLTKTKAKDTEKSFSIEVNVDVPGDLQKTAPDANNEWKPVFDDHGNAVTAAGKVDAYRFKTFYLDSSDRNFEDLFGKVVDPIWLAGDSPNAVALRQAQQSDKKPPCWRVFHRVTFVSRILPDFPDLTEPPLEAVLKAQDIDSNWLLIQKLDPFVRSKTQDAVAFADAVRQALNTYLPELAPHSDEIIDYLKIYYGIID
ncbi:MAG: LamG domain-containing protein [Coleofasciculus sp. G3-WIS-01]|uniref:LamG domain-containing protein n=1 Tax=Coleofasciculus sp. G3-WIS-01 TaxID=3069528 RepID=UPI0032F15313